MGEAPLQTFWHLEMGWGCITGTKFTSARWYLNARPMPQWRLRVLLVSTASAHHAIRIHQPPQRPAILPRSIASRALGS